MDPRVICDNLEMQMFNWGVGLLAQVAQDYNLNHGELMKKYMKKPSDIGLRDGSGAPSHVLVAATEQKAKNKKERKPKEGKTLCKGVTAKGQQCKFGACEGSEFCKKHGEANKDNTVKTKKTPKEHNHNPGDVPTEFCGVCESHGDVTDPKLTEEEFEIKYNDVLKFEELGLSEEDLKTEEDPKTEEDLKTEEDEEDPKTEEDEEEEKVSEETHRLVHNILLEEEKMTDEDEDED